MIFVHEFVYVELIEVVRFEKPKIEIVVIKSSKSWCTGDKADSTILQDP